MLKNKKKQKILFLSLVLMLLIGTGTVAAFIVTNSQEVKNNFDPSQVSCEVKEDFKVDGDVIVKEDVVIENTSDIDAYIRAKIVVTWKKKIENDDGSITTETYGIPPVEGVDYIIEFDSIEQSLEDKGWIAGADGFYYYTDRVAPDALTNVLIESCIATAGTTPEGYFLSVEILGSAIQADGVNANGTKAVVDAWVVDPEKL